jgi:predicted TIM-barrel fold metal-dependent hydrolase
VLQDKICFGSDYPPIDPGAWLEDFRALFAEGYEFGGKKHQFRPGIYEKVVRLNALKALGIT